MRPFLPSFVGLIFLVCGCQAPQAIGLADGGAALDASTTLDSGVVDAGTVDAGASTVDAGVNDAGRADAGLLACSPPAGLSRGALWQRSHPMFISGLTVVMGSPSERTTTDYVSSFRATAAHTWATGLPDEVAGWVDAGVPYVSWLSSDGTSVNNLSCSAAGRQARCASGTR